MCLCLSISDTDVGTLAETSESGLVVLEAFESAEVVEPMKFCSRGPPRGPLLLPTLL